MNTTRLLCLAAALLLAGCAGTANAPALYLLDTQPKPTAAPDRPARATLVVAPVRLAPVLDESGIVYQTGPHRVVIANHNRWAAPLGAQLRDSLIQNLGDALPGVQVVRGEVAAEPATLTLNTRVNRFMGHYNGQARIAGTWQLVGANGDTLVDQRFTRDIALADDGYDALVNSLSEGWQASAQAIAPEIANAASRTR